MTPDYLSRWLVLGLVLSLPFICAYCNGARTPLWVGVTGAGVLVTCAVIGKVVQSWREK